jgi:hypothetical protein
MGGPEQDSSGLEWGQMKAFYEYINVKLQVPKSLANFLIN